VDEFFSAYGLFLVELATLAGIVVIVIVAASARRGAQRDGLTVKHLNKQYDDAASVIKRAVLAKDQYKKEAKRLKHERKQRREQATDPDGRRRLFVLDFKGDLRASATVSLAREITAVLAVATDHDRVLVRLENAGGLVHEHGLAASQLMRIKARGIELLVAVDKVAASGGYLMACVADRLMAAPFAVIGSIGVIAQLPNFHRLLESKGVDFEQITAGRYKRTLTLFGENTEDGRRKLQQELEDVHALFKTQISEHRPQVDLDEVATGEHWYGVRALELALIDEIRTSDDFLLDAVREDEVYQVTYRRRRALVERVLGATESLLSR
jgi:serine protease SohB